MDNTRQTELHPIALIPKHPKSGRPLAIHEYAKFGIELKFPTQLTEDSNPANVDYELLDRYQT